MPQRQPLVEWARSASLHPPRWGEIETAILTRASAPAPGAFHYVVLVIIALLAAVLYGAPLIGLALIVAYAEPGQAMPAGPESAASLAFFVALVGPGTTLAAWRSEQRRRQVPVVPALASIVSGAGYLLVRPAEAEWAGLASLLATLFGLGVTIAILVASKPNRGRTRLPFLIRVRTFMSPPLELHYREQRERGLAELIEQDFIHPDDALRQRLTESRLGGWRMLD